MGSGNKGHGASEPAITSCPLCGATSVSELYRIVRYDHPFPVDRCASCGFIFRNPQPNHEDIMSLYDREYYTGEAEYSYYDERDAERYSRYVWDKRVKFIAGRQNGGRILDIGSSFGGFLTAAKPYFTPFGIEISPYAGGYARNTFGENIHIGTIHDHPFDYNSFSVITLIEVLEHLPDPVYTVEECHRLLKPGGLLVIQTADMNAMQARIKKGKYAYFMPGHLSYFTEANLTALLGNTGFGRIKRYYPVEFGLLPKLKKSRYYFESPLHYLRMLRIVAYHLISKIHMGSFAMTSSMVIYTYKI